MVILHVNILLICLPICLSAEISDYLSDFSVIRPSVWSSINAESLIVQNNAESELIKITLTNLAV